MIAAYLASDATFDFVRPVLKRIADNRDAQAALNAIARNEDDIRKLFDMCINAEMIFVGSHNFSQRHHAKQKNFGVTARVSPTSYNLLMLPLSRPNDCAP